MIFFITFLRAIAACIITNAHYTGIYPTDLIANGGLLGDVLFFAVSGYCLYNVKFPLSIAGFARWYGKRIWRIYPPVLIITATFMILGVYSMGENGVFWWYIYPTCYHFVASIMALYILFFFIMRIDTLKGKIPVIMLGVSVTWLIVYFTVYDRSYYHIDTVREPMIRFLFLESMLLGAWFRQRDKELRDKFRAVYPVAAIIASMIYFISKLLFSKIASISNLQFLNQIALFLLLYFIFRTSCGLDGKLERMPKTIKTAVNHISDMTLEIYVVQYGIIQLVKFWGGGVFPVNWIILTTAILFTAFALHKVCGWLYVSVNIAFRRGEFA